MDKGDSFMWMGSPVDGIGRIALLLRVLASAEPKGLTTSEVAIAAELPRPTVHRMLSSMRTEGLVDRSPEGEWLLGPELYFLGLGAAERYVVRDIAQPLIRRLAVATGESASLSLKRGDETVCIVHEEGTFPLRSHVLHEGIRFPLGVASAGLAILAFLSPEEQRSYLDDAGLASRWGAHYEPVPLRQRLDRTRATGYSVNPGLVVHGSWGMAAAVVDGDERPFAAVSLTGVESRFGEQRRPVLGAQLMRAAQELSRLLNGRRVH
jgi:DNA-binding IclR family transcriptional regulator